MHSPHFPSGQKSKAAREISSKSGVAKKTMVTKLLASLGVAWATALTALGIASMIAGLLYYSVSLIAHARGKDHIDEPAYFELDPHHIGREPWANGEWEAVGAPAVKLQVRSTDSEPIVVVTGLHTGSIYIRITAISHEGSTYRGDAVCAEHGGKVAPVAYLHRLVDNRLRLKITPTSEAVAPIDIFFSHVPTAG